MDPTTYLFVPAPGGGALPAELGVARRLAARGHRVVVLTDGARSAEVRAAGAELRPWSPPGSGTPAEATATCLALRAVRPDAAVVAAACLGAVVAAERYSVPLALLGPCRPPVAGHDPRLDAVRADHGLPPVASVADQLQRADRHLDLDVAVDILVAELEALPGVRPWLPVDRTAPGVTVAERVPVGVAG